MATLRVMTRNLYVGSEFAPVMSAATPEEALAAVPEVHREIVESDFASRAERVAAEIADATPDVVGLQEVAAVRSGPLQGPVEEMEIDYLELLQGALGRAGAEYDVVAQTWNIDATMPLGSPPAKMLRLTDRDVLLTRPGLALGKAATGAFAANAALEVAGGSIPLTRGWISAEIEVNGTNVLLVTTHLETSLYADVQVAQARELLDSVLDTERPVVLIGDLNTQAPESPAYRVLVEAGFRDAWTSLHGDDPGLTCCQDANLRNPESSLYERIDLVLVRGPFDVTAVERTGETLTARTESGLWPSDHAGVVATLELMPT